LIERGIALHPIEKDAANSPQSIDILCPGAAQTGEPDRALPLRENTFDTVQWRLATGMRSRLRSSGPRSDVRSAPKLIAFSETRGGETVNLRSFFAELKRWKWKTALAPGIRLCYL